MKLNCVITDDEPIALDILEDYIRMMPGLNLIARCQDSIETFNILKQEKVDLLLIDIQMPGINGLDFVRSLRTAPFIIFTTAYPNYALEGFDLDAVDYLLKPISLERFIRGIDKAFSRIGQRSVFPVPETAINTEPDRKSFFIKTGSGLSRVEFEKVLYVEGLENYVKIVAEDKTLISLNTMKNMEGIFQFPQFLRIHRSFIVNLNKVDSIKENTFTLCERSIVVGKSYRKNVSELMRKYFSG